MAPSYQAYMRSKAWRSLRVQVIKRAKGICERCEIHPVAHVHHKTYERFGKEPLSDLEGLCVKCHLILHQGGDQ